MFKSSGRYLDVKRYQFILCRYGYFKVTVTPEYTTQITSTFKFTGKIEGHKSSTIRKLPISSGTFLILLISKNEGITIKIENDGYMPSCFIALEWLGDFTYRGKSNLIRPEDIQVISSAR